MQPLGTIIKVLSLYWYRGILTAYFKGDNEYSSVYNVPQIVLKIYSNMFVNTEISVTIRKPW